ncbi:MAG TPA: hypothetical protein VIV60_25090 [Polyangiaceae bacterium]
MNNSTRGKDPRQKASEIIAAAGGTLVGRTRLQKLAYLLELAGLGEGFYFEYRHYGPFSEDLALATRDATYAGLIQEKEEPTSWGGFYSVYSTSPVEQNEVRRAFAQLAKESSAVVLELAATAAFLAEEGANDPWQETARRKPDKAADGRLERAKVLYLEFTKIRAPKELPKILPTINSCG